MKSQEKSFPVPFLRTPFNYDRDAASDESGLSCGEPSRAIQSAAEECDINTIVKRFGLTGKLPDVLSLPQYGDFTGVTDYQSALNLVMAADSAFMQLPADLRARFHHDPANLLNFVSSEANREEAQRMGLLRPIQAPETIIPGGTTSPTGEAPKGAPEPA